MKRYPRIAVAQLGARMHYGVAVALQRKNLLGSLFTDAYAPRWLRSVVGNFPLLLRLRMMQQLMAMHAPGLPDLRIRTQPMLALWRKVGLSHARNIHQCGALHLRTSKMFCERVAARLGPVQAVYAMSGAALELFHACRRRGIRTILEQPIAPGPVQDRFLWEEQRRWPGWEELPSLSTVIRAGHEREVREWEAADLIVAPSRFVIDGLVSVGVDAEKCMLVPYGQSFHRGAARLGRHGGPLRVLFAGTLCLRKGIPYVLEAARELGSRAIFRAAGSVALSPTAVRFLSGHVEIMGPVPRIRMAEQFRWADVMILPSLCEGSATVIYEAMAHGLPVICTPNCGSTIVHDHNGFIVPVRSVAAIIKHLCNLEENAELYGSISRAAAASAGAYNMEAYGDRMAAVVRHAMVAQ